MGDKAYKARHKSLGLCIECGNKAEFNRVRCEKCGKKMNKSANKCHATRADRGLCHECGKPLGTSDSGFKSHNRAACKPSRRKDAICGY